MKKIILVLSVLVLLSGAVYLISFHNYEASYTFPDVVDQGYGSDMPEYMLNEEAITGLAKIYFGNHFRLNITHNYVFKDNGDSFTVQASCWPSFLRGYLSIDFSKADLTILEMRRTQKPYLE